MNWESLVSVNTLGWAVLGILLVSQAWWIFRDAKKRGYNPWLWGAFGMLNVPSSLVIYLLVVNHIGCSRKGRDPRDNQ